MATADKVNSILENIKKSQVSSAQSEESTDQISNLPRKNKDIKVDVRGKPKSGRFWKSKKERFATINKTKGLRQDFQKKTALRLELKRSKELSKQMVEQLQEREASRKQRRRDNLRQAEENRRRAEVVQVISNTAKLRRMKKKQLRFIEKRDTNQTVDASK